MRTPSMILAAGLLLLFALPAGADPLSEGALPPARSTASHFGFSGTRPVSAFSRSGIVRPTTPPRLRASTFGSAASKPVAPRPKVSRPAVSRPVVSRPAPITNYVSCAAPTCTTPSCAPCTTTVCAPPAFTTETTWRDKLSVPTAFWSSGYHDGKERYTTRTVRSVDPCTGACTTTVYPPPCEPVCAPVCEPVCRPTCEPVCEPVYEPVCEPVCEPQNTRVIRVIRRPVPRYCAPRVRVVAPCYTPCAAPCFSPWAPAAIGFGWGLGWGLGWGWGGGCW